MAFMWRTHFAKDTLRSRNAFAMTDTELRDMAKAASSKHRLGIEERDPAAMAVQSKFRLAFVIRFDHSAVPASS
jgi:hypothetical protein